MKPTAQLKIDMSAAAAAAAATTPDLGTSANNSRSFNPSLTMNVDVAANGSPNSHSSLTSSTSSAPVYSDDVRGRVSALSASLDLPPCQGSVSSTKACEVDLGEGERDSYSPLSSSHSNSPSDGDNNVAGIYNGSSVAPPPLSSQSTSVFDNKIVDGCLQSQLHAKVSSISITSAALTPPPSKEEKQRQNEEIVIMETSSISSETGSWESVFPHVVPTGTAVASSQPALAVSSAFGYPEARNKTKDMRSFCAEFLQNERQRSSEKPKDKQERDQQDRAASAAAFLLRDPALSSLREAEPYRTRTYSTGATGAVTADTSSLFNGVCGGSSSSLLLLRNDNPLTTSGTSACFIDASSLRDEDEDALSFPSLDGQQSVDGLDGLAKEREPDLKVHSVETTERRAADDDDSPTKQLETFHKAFAKCRVKPDSLEAPQKPATSSSSSSGSHSPHNEASTASLTNNLSDEEKLWKREISAAQSQRPNRCPEVKVYQDDKEVQNSQDTNLAQFSTAHEDVTEPSISLAGDFDSSDSSEIVKLRREQERRQSAFVFQQPLQQHHKLPFHISAATAPHSDLSYTTDYSSSSPAPSLIWSEHEHRLSTNSGITRLPLHHQLHVEDYDSDLHKSGNMMPETPHNSIVHISDTNLSASSSIHRDYTLSSSCSQQRDSGAYCSDATESPLPIPRTPKRSKCDEANAIISGGSTAKDFGPKKCDSPVVKRRTDTCPIVSGGFRSLDFETTNPQTDEDDGEVELRVKPTTRKPISALTSSWIVDMGNCRQERHKSASSSTSSVECAQLSRFRERTDSGSSNKSGCGFYVSLEHVNTQQESGEDQARKPTQMSKSYSGPRSTGFPVALNEHEMPNKSAKNDRENGSQAIQSTSGAQVDKNLFSMFIELSEKKTPSGVKREPFSLAARLSSSFTSSSSSSPTSTQHQLRRAEDQIHSGASSTETLMSKSNTIKMHHQDSDVTNVESKSLDYKCNLDKPITVAELRRISQQQRVKIDSAKRHSWNQGGPSDAETAVVSTDYRRSISLTANGCQGDTKETSGGGLMSIIDKLPLISKTSSLSIDSSLSPFEDLMGSKSELSSCSNASGGEEGFANRVPRIKKRRGDVEINETFDKSSLASITDGILSKDLSPASTTDTDDLTFQQDEELANRETVLGSVPPVMPVSSARSSAVIMETILEAKETSSPKKKPLGHTLETLHATIEKQKQLLETVNEHGGIDTLEKSSSAAAFVKLSDMDKPVKYDPHSPEILMSKSAGGTHRQMGRLFRDEVLKSSSAAAVATATARPHSWTMMTRSTGNASFLNITTSVDNLRSLSRIFPNFSKEFSNSLPNDMILDQQVDDYIQTDISADSSLASSFSRSGMDESSISCRQPRRLGEDLLKMFLQEIATDMMVEVSGRRIRAHKCILRSRCQYFAAMLAGNGAPQSVVALPGYSYPAVHFALCHIYSGASHPPDGISLMELAALADLLGLEGLKEVTAHALKTNYCHNFHKPCSGCIDGILQVLPVALNHALDDLYRKCLRWTCRHYLKVWPTRQFAQLPLDILGRCRQQIMAYMTSETVLDTVLDCDILICQLASFRWGDVCKTIVRDIMDAAYAYIGDHFASLIASDAFLSLGHDKSCHIPRLQEMLLRTASNLSADQACRSYQRVTRLNTVLQAKVIKMPPNLGELAKELQGLQEEELDWDPEYVRMVSAILSAVEQCLTRQCSRAMRVTAWQRMDLELRKKIQTLARLTEPIDLKRNGSKPVAKAFSFGGSTRNQDLYQVKLAIQAHSKRALAQDTQLYKATQTQEVGFNVQTAERGVQASHDPRDSGTGKILKSNSRARVPQVFKGAQNTTVACSERKAISTHRRTQSEAPVSLTLRAATIQPQPIQKQPEAKAVATVVRLTEIRPRYLEPRKPRALSATNGPVRSATSGSITATKAKGQHQISSSDSSRNSSPAARKRLGTAAISKSTRSSVNMSMDSLASPSRRPKHNMRSSADNDRYSDADSMRSSVVSNTNKTVSQESLAGAGKRLARSNPQNLLGKTHVATSNHINNNNSAHNKIFRATQQTVSNVTNSKVNGNVLKPQIKAAPQRAQQKQLQLHQQTAKLTSTGSSPSSVATKSTSRLSSVSSTTSARDLYKNRSISVPAGADKNSPTAHQQRRSFLSAKSREILARRAEKNKQQQQVQQAVSSGDEKQQSTHTQPAAGPIRSSSLAAVPSAMGMTGNRNSLTSNIPTRRPNTLHLKKTHPPTTNDHHNNNSSMRTTTTNIRNRVANIHGYKTAAVVAQAVQQKIELLIDNAVRPTLKEEEKNASAVESKLERSITFCKESSDLDLNELQIIE